MAKELGLRSKKNCHLNKTVIHRLIQQPFYYSEMRVKGEMWSHGYQAIITKETLSYLKNTNELKKAEHDQATASLKKEHTENENRLNSLIDLRLSGELSKKEFQTKKQQLKDRQYEIDRLLKTYDEADDKFTDTATMLITLASQGL
ncbi:hypothetical protein [Candidatus Tisiphia endosymbiont of Melanophora roralis]|uniref:hypothetical protein n=1 Tax=Candidatus Tisiphia endosymbiont of Melanophora roralis TaxID=3066261 RepID=UPI001E7B4CBF|nr:MAG: hypothetical protein LF884_00910 [Rickettsia endosymbiont of Cimex lectularius]